MMSDDNVENFIHADVNSNIQFLPFWDLFPILACSFSLFMKFGTF